MKKYKDKVDALVDFAEKAAQERVKKLGKETEERIGKDGKPFNWDFFTEFFHEEMDRMCKEMGLR